VILEPVQNAGGCLVPPQDYWMRVREICDKHGVLLVSDSVICAFGRLGEWFGIERFGVLPDMISFAKGVTSGYLPMGGVVVNDEISSTLRENAPMFAHGSTFGGHPVSSAVALENIAIMEREKLLGNVHDLEGHFGDELRRMATDHPIVKEVRGMGFFWAVEVRPERADGTPVSGRDYQENFKGLLARKLLEGGPDLPLRGQGGSRHRVLPRARGGQGGPQPDSGDHRRRPHRARTPDRSQSRELRGRKVAEKQLLACGMPCYEGPHCVPPRDRSERVKV
jgi:glutamate-1-semialdehyde aminotransferase